MPSSHRFSQFFRPSLPFVLFGVMLVCLWLAGGASRPDTLGQTVVRGFSWGFLAIALVFGSRPTFSQIGPALTFLLLMLALALVQLVPLPPAFWQALPGRAVLTDAALLTGEAQPWRPLSMMPGATLNAASSLVVPFVALLLVSNLKEEERLFMPLSLLMLVTASMIVGMLQFSSLQIDNMFVNEMSETVSGTFANRNHFALLLAIGCLLAPVWAAMSRRNLVWCMILASGLILLFLLTILISGSRAGLGLGILGVLLGFLISSRAIRRALRHHPRWVFPALVVGVFGGIAVCVLLSVLAGRAISIDRIVAAGQEQDMRLRGLPVVLTMIREYFPFGSGLGSFDPVFRMHEPAELLKPSYFNHAHDDFLEIVLTAGLPGLLLLVLSICWWAWASFCAWRTWEEGSHDLPKLGSAVLLLVFLASIFDYPARTPTIMTVVAVAAFWLAGSARPPALPPKRSLL